MEQRPYQKTGTSFLKAAERAILADEPGLGKTNQMLLASEGRTLVISAAILEDVWADEAAMWIDDSIAVLDWGSYSGVCRRVAKNQGGPATFVSPEPRDLYDRHWDTLILDEAHHIKNRNANWTKAIFKVAKQADRVYLGTGTPLPNWGHEIYMFLRMLYPGDRRFSSYWRWLNDYFRTWKPPYGGTEIKGLHRGLTWETAATEWGLPGRWLRREVEEVLPDLPPMTTQTVGVQMGPTQQRAYDQLKRDFIAQLDNGTERIAWHEGAQHTLLWQASTGLSTLDPTYKGKGGSAKLDAVRELLAERTRPTILFCAFKNTAEALGRLGESMGRRTSVVSSAYSMTERKAAVRAFKDGEVDVLAGTIGTIREGLTLTRADCCVFVERSPIPTRNEQARRRIRRFGQERPTLAIDLVTEGTVDAQICAWLADKAEDSDAALTGIQLASMVA